MSASRIGIGLAALLAAGPAMAADALTGEVQKQATNVTAIAMFLAFVVATLAIT